MNYKLHILDFFKIGTKKNPLGQYKISAHLNKVEILPTHFLILLLLFFSHNLLAQPEKKISVPITNVTVFKSQAQIERQTKLNLEEGVYTLLIDKISPNLIANSMEVTSQNGITILSVSTKNDYLIPDDKPAFIISLEDSLEVLNEQLTDIKADKESIVLQKDLLLANKNIGGTTQGVKAEELEDVLSIYQKKLLDFKVEWMKLSKQEKSLNAIVQKINQQLNEFKEGTLTLNNQILIQVKVDHSISDALLAVRYLVNGVQWQPFYDIRVKDTKSPVQFLLKATIQQSTGELWKNVKLKITTANPMEGGTKPILPTNYLRFFEPMVYAIRGSRVLSKNIIDDAAKAPRALGSGNNSESEVQITQNMINTEFEVATLHTIPSDWKIHQVELTSFSQPAVYGHSVVPKLDKDVFVIAQIQASDLINQISGEANVFFDGTFTGKTFINPTTNDTLILTLGRDKRIKVDRIRVREMSSKSFFGSTRKESSTYEMSVKNTGSEIIDLFIEDQIPISTDKEIICTLLDKGTADFNSETGSLKWHVKLGNQQTDKYRFSFEITYPANKKLNPY